MGFHETVEAEIEQRIRARTNTLQWRPNYEEWVQNRIWQERYRNPVVSNLRRYVPEWKQAVIVELGSGMGGLVVRLQQEGLRAFGIDYCFDYCVITKLRGMRHGLQTRVINGQGESLPLEAQSVDVIFCYEVIEHVFDPAEILQEMHRVVKPGGAVFISIPNRWTPYDHHYHMWGISYLPRPVADWLIAQVGRNKGNDTSAGVQKLSEMHYFTLPSFRALCNRVGFSIFDIRQEKVAEYVARVFPIHRLVHLLDSLAILRLAYRIYRYTIMEEWHFILKPKVE